ncbi:DUF2905 domain-containing protein [bacterium]|nr:DUF2905 domain-containing protein [bacterium]
MGELQTIGRWLFIAGVALAVVGALVWLLGRFTNLQGLPGTVKVEIPGMTCVIPLLGSIVLSILLTIVINLILRGSNR